MPGILRLDPAILTIFLRYGACVNTRDIEGRTYIHQLFINDHRFLYDSVEYWLQRRECWIKMRHILAIFLGANFDIRANDKNSISVTDMAVVTGFQKIWQEALTSFGYDPIEVMSSELMVDLVSTTAGRTTTVGARVTTDEILCVHLIQIVIVE
ncbi:hypothetical protein FPQ18DRAFT_308358 [Pyronema domesticum]|nr:hypothetical protein FPQ18DRAFT_308358 [Pyronema domesticum]